MNPDDHVPACRCIWCASDPRKVTARPVKETPTC